MRSPFTKCPLVSGGPVQCTKTRPSDRLSVAPKESGPSGGCRAQTCLGVLVCETVRPPHPDKCRGFLIQDARLCTIIHIGLILPVLGLGSHRWREKDTRSLLPERPGRCFAQKTPGVFFGSLRASRWAAGPSNRRYGAECRTSRGIIAQAALKNSVVVLDPFCIAGLGFVPVFGVRIFVAASRRASNPSRGG